MKRLSQKIYNIFAFLPLFAISCAPTKVESPALEITEESSKVESENHAIKLAMRHLALRNANWGEISDVKEEPGYYKVAFKTPTQELRLLGQRAILVKKDSGLVSIVQRR